MKKLSTKVNILPVIAGLTKTEIRDLDLKVRILAELGAAEIRIYQLSEADSEETAPPGGIQLLSVCGTVEVENPEHCDFTELIKSLVRQIQDMQDVSHDLHYKTYAALMMALKTIKR